MTITRNLWSWTLCFCATAVRVRFLLISRFLGPHILSSNLVVNWEYYSIKWLEDYIIAVTIHVDHLLSIGHDVIRTSNSLVHFNIRHLPCWFLCSLGNSLTSSYSQWDPHVPSIQPSFLVCLIIGWDVAWINAIKAKTTAKNNFILATQDSDWDCLALSSRRIVETSRKALVSHQIISI